ITQQKRITICGSNDGITCSRDWERYLIIFVDENRDKQADTNELYYSLDVGISESNMTTRVSAGLPYIDINVDGSARQLGSIIICPRANNDRAIRRITWNRSGR